jgi:hypothetical protein
MTAKPVLIASGRRTRITGKEPVEVAGRSIWEISADIVAGVGLDPCAAWQVRSRREVSFVLSAVGVVIRLKVGAITTDWSGGTWSCQMQPY